MPLTNDEVDAVFDAFDRAPRQTSSNAKDRRAKGHNVLPVTDFSAMQTASAKTWTVHHLLGVGECSVWFGEPGCGKSALIEDVGLHVAAGRLWHGRKVKQGAVLFVALERAAVVIRRAIAFGKEHGLSDEALPFAVLRGPLDF